VMLHVEYGHGRPETYAMPLAFAEEAEPHESMRTPGLVIANVSVTNVPERGTVGGAIYDATCSDQFGAALLRAMLTSGVAPGQLGALAGSALAPLRELPTDTFLVPRLVSAEQSNTSIVYSDRLMLKLFRVVEEG